MSSNYIQYGTYGNISFSVQVVYTYHIQKYNPASTNIKVASIMLAVIDAEMNVGCRYILLVFPYSEVHCWIIWEYYF